MSKRRAFVIVALAVLALSSLPGQVVARDPDETRPGGTTGAAWTSDKYVWTGGVSAYDAVAVAYHIDIAPDTLVYAGWLCDVKGAGFYGTTVYSGGVYGSSRDMTRQTNGDLYAWVGARIGPLEPASANPRDSYCAYHVWVHSGTGGFRITTSTLDFWLAVGGGDPTASGAVGPGGSTFAGSSASPSPTPAAAPCGSWREVQITDASGTYGASWKYWRMDFCAGGGSAVDGGQFDLTAGQALPADIADWTGYPSSGGKALFWYIGTDRVCTGAAGGAGAQNLVFFNGSYIGVSVGACGAAASNVMMSRGTPSATAGTVVKIRPQCGNGACTESVPGGGVNLSTSSGGATVLFGLVMAANRDPSQGSDTTPVPSPSPSSSPLASPTPTPSAPPPGPGYFPPINTVPSPGPNLGGNGGYVPPDPYAGNPTGIAACDADDGTFSKVGQAALHPLNDTSFPGSTNPLEYIPWVGNMIANVPLVVDNVRQTAQNTASDWIIPGTCVSNIVEDQQTALFATGPLAVYEDVRGQVEGAIAATAGGSSAGNCTFAVPLPGGSNACIPFATWAASIGSVRNFLVVGIWFFVAIGCYRLIVGAFHTAKADIEDGRNIDVWLQ